jgi:hypothetical protein
MAHAPTRAEPVSGPTLERPRFDQQVTPGTADLRNAGATWEDREVTTALSSPVTA